MSKVYVDLDETWIFTPRVGLEIPDELPEEYKDDLNVVVQFNIQKRINREIDQGGFVELPDEYIEQYKRISEQFWAMNQELEEIYRRHFMKKDVNA